GARRLAVSRDPGRRLGGSRGRRTAGSRRRRLPQRRRRPLFPHLLPGGARVMRRSLFGVLLTLSLTVLAARPAGAETHVRVVLDTSKSMLKTDAAHLAKLSTLLLYDLAQTNSTLGDSFEVIPFHPRQKWVRPSDPPP